MKARGVGMNQITVGALALLFAMGGPTALAQDTEAPMQVRVRYIVNDVPEAVAFYTGKLGFRIDAQAGPTFAALSRNGVQLLLSPTKGPGGASQPMPNGDKPAPGGGWTRMVIDVKDLEADVDRLRKQGVHFRNDIIVGLGGNQILLDDPSGNVIELFQSTIVYSPPQTPVRDQK